MSKTDKIIIVGAGLCGTLLAVRLAERGYQVQLHEKRADMRLEEVDAGRSINLALSARGIRALSLVNIENRILEQCIPMHGRFIHKSRTNAWFSPYSGRKEDYINSMSREGLNIELLNRAESLPNLDLYFNSKCTFVDIKSGTATFEHTISKEESTFQGDVVFGTDGAGSAVRKSMMKHTTKLLFNYSQNFLRHGYKELSILPDEHGGFRLEKNALHIWPRGNFMIIALPNLDRSFTVTMFHPFEGEAGFNTMKTRADVQQMFEKHYPELIEYMPHYLDEYEENPVGTLGTIKCYPWQAYGKTMVLGDASHAIVPFYGQGMNASFEDVWVLDQYITEYEGDWAQILFMFQEERVDDANAIADLALDNFYEMRDGVDDPDFVRKRKLEMELEQRYPDYYSKYSLVTFKPDIPYADAMRQGRLQDSFLLNLCKDELPNAEEVLTLLKQQDWYTNYGN